jgi:cytoskeletal protein CcmA (bactofilin family)
VSENEIGTLVIDKPAHIQGNIYYTNLIVAGTLDGNIYASGSVEIYPSAVIRGDIHPEAKVNGRLNCFNLEQKNIRNEASL